MVDEDAVPEGADRSIAQYLVCEPESKVGGSRGNSVRHLLSGVSAPHGRAFGQMFREEGPSD